MTTNDEKQQQDEFKFNRLLNDRLKDRVKQVVGDFTLPKEVLHYMLKQVDETKDATLGIVSKEIRHFLENEDISAILTEVLTKVSFELTMKARFVENDKKAGFKLQITPDYESGEKNEEPDAASSGNGEATEPGTNDHSADSGVADADKS
jgi:hypothetical protein